MNAERDPRPVTVFPPRRRQRWPWFLIGAVAWIVLMYAIGASQ